MYSAKFRKILIAALLSAGWFMTSPLHSDALPWGVGEKLTFAVRWGMITGGYAHMEVREKLSLDGRDTYRLVSQARSAALFDPFYRVRDVIESYMDSAKLRTVRYEEDINEGSYSRNTVIIYDHERGYAFQNGNRFAVSPQVQDILSSLYFLRTKDLEVGKTYEVDVGTSGESWPLVISVEGRERIRVPAGRFNTLVVVPQIRDGDGIFKKAQGTLKVWLTDDDRKIPVLMRSRIPIGTISAVLIDKELPSR